MLATKYPTALKASENTFINIDHKQMGVGGDDSWSPRVYPEFRLTDTEYEYSFIMKMINGEAEIGKFLLKELPMVK